MVFPLLLSFFRMPLRGQRYRLNTPTLAIIQHDGQNCPTTIPDGAVVKVVAGPLDGNRLVDVMWDGKTARMFTTDIRERCVKLEGA
jgi:hypothetical protein